MGDDGRTLESLLLVFLPLSLVSIGGGPAVLAELQHQSVNVHGWMTQREFSNLFAISRVAPGPGALLATLIGWKAAGWLGALIVTLAFFLPTSLVVYGAARLWHRWRGPVWHSAVEAGFAPVASGLAFAGAFVVLQSQSAVALAWATALGVAACRIYWPDCHPVILLSLGAVGFAIARSFT